MLVLCTIQQCLCQRIDFDSLLNVLLLYCSEILTLKCPPCTPRSPCTCAHQALGAQVFTELSVHRCSPSSRRTGVHRALGAQVFTELSVHRCSPSSRRTGVHRALGAQMFTENLLNQVTKVAVCLCTLDTGSTQAYCGLGELSVREISKHTCSVQHLHAQEIDIQIVAM